MSEVFDKTEEIKKVNLRHRYPWSSLKEVGDMFRISAENKAGVNNSRQLCYAANKSAARNGSEVRYKGFKQPDGSVVVKRIV